MSHEDQGTRAERPPNPTIEDYLAVIASLTPDEKVAALRARGIFIDYEDRVREGSRQQAEIIKRVWPGLV